MYGVFMIKGWGMFSIMGKGFVFYHEAVAESESCHDAINCFCYLYWLLFPCQKVLVFFQILSSILL